ncbi:MAG: DUF4262 domain-containing protein [Armatimonadetes bacterium]|nr:DUF4262 domain-containing protein [Armatimonadota bacterium]
MLPEPTDDYDRIVIENINRYDWHVVIVPEDDEGVGFAYTVGLTYRFAHAEIIIFGLSNEVMHSILNVVGTDIKNGKRFVANTQVGGIVEGYDCAFAPVNQTQHNEYLGYCVWLYKKSGFDVLQCFWTDKAGRFPWEDGFPEPLKAKQPILSRVNAEKRGTL